MISFSRIILYSLFPFPGVPIPIPITIPSPKSRYLNGRVMARSFIMSEGKEQRKPMPARKLRAENANLSSLSSSLPGSNVPGKS
jgi:hypothetical protein